MMNIRTTLLKINHTIGNIFIWLALLLTLVTFLVVVLRYGFNYGSIPLQETITYMNASMFMLCAGYVLKLDEHVRLDLFYRNLTVRKKAIVNLCGFFFALLPMCTVIIVFSFDYVLNSWIYLETSREPGGLPLIFALKSLIIIMPLLLLLQGIADVIKDYHSLKND